MEAPPKRKAKVVVSNSSFVENFRTWEIRWIPGQAGLTKPYKIKHKRGHEPPLLFIFTQGNQLPIEAIKAAKDLARKFDKEAGRKTTRPPRAALPQAITEPPVGPTEVPGPTGAPGTLKTTSWLRPYRADAALKGLSRLAEAGIQLVGSADLRATLQANVERWLTKHRWAILHGHIRIGTPALPLRWKTFDVHEDVVPETGAWRSRNLGRGDIFQISLELPAHLRTGPTDLMWHPNDAMAFYLHALAHTATPPAWLLVHPGGALTEARLQAHGELYKINLLAIADKAAELGLFRWWRADEDPNQMRFKDKFVRIYWIGRKSLSRGFLPGAPQPDDPVVERLGEAFYSDPREAAKGEENDTADIDPALSVLPPERMARPWDSLVEVGLPIPLNLTFLDGITPFIASILAKTTTPVTYALIGKFIEVGDEQRFVAYLVAYLVMAHTTPSVVEHPDMVAHTPMAVARRIASGIIKLLEVERDSAAYRSEAQPFPGDREWVNSLVNLASMWVPGTEESAGRGHLLDLKGTTPASHTALLRFLADRYPEDPILSNWHLVAMYQQRPKAFRNDLATKVLPLSGVGSREGTNLDAIMADIMALGTVGPLEVTVIDPESDRPVKLVKLMSGNFQAEGTGELFSPEQVTKRFRVMEDFMYNEGLRYSSYLDIVALITTHKKLAEKFRGNWIWKRLLQRDFAHIAALVEHNMDLTMQVVDSMSQKPGRPDTAYKRIYEWAVRTSGPTHGFHVLGYLRGWANVWRLAELVTYTEGTLTFRSLLEPDLPVIRQIPAEIPGAMEVDLEELRYWVVNGPDGLGALVRWTPGTEGGMIAWSLATGRLLPHNIVSGNPAYMADVRKGRFGELVALSNTLHVLDVDPERQQKSVSREGRTGLMNPSRKPHTELTFITGLAPAGPTVPLGLSSQYLAFLWPYLATLEASRKIVVIRDITNGEEVWRGDLPKGDFIDGLITMNESTLVLGYHPSGGDTTITLAFIVCFDSGQTISITIGFPDTTSTALSVHGPYLILQGPERSVALRFRFPSPGGPLADVRQRTLLSSARM
jgi:hypothetical protein